MNKEVKNYLRVQRKLVVLEYAKVFGSNLEAYKACGIPRSTFYDWEKAYNNEGEYMRNHIPRLAWEYNNPPIIAISNSQIMEEPFFTSSDNIILHSCQRTGDELELRFAECMGKKGLVKFNVNLLNKDARLTNFLGEGDEILQKDAEYSMQINPQQIVTVRFKTEDSVQKIVPLTDWTPLVPDSKRAYLNKYDESFVGHPPR